MTIRAFEYLLALRAQRGHTLPIPGAAPDLPERFRGRPSLAVDGDADTQPVGRDTGVTRTRSLPVVDLGACLFAPDEPAPPGARMRWTGDVSMAARSRDGLVITPGSGARAEPLGQPIRALLGRSLRLRSVSAGSCNGCEAELVALGNVVFDIARFGVQFVASPRHADGIVITGAVSANMRRALEDTYDAVPDPRIVIAVGACPASGGPFAGSPEVVGIPSGLPVDLWVPGCPPHPLTILDGLLNLLGRNPHAGT